MTTEQEQDRLSRHREVLAAEVSRFGVEQLVLAFGAWLAGMVVSLAVLAWEWAGNGRNWSHESPTDVRRS